ncbi:hypothetical protein H696_06211 [Fonticula alba]|uniref:Roadblock/LAMTOR2 domain-containing protein n=1 Tax=Fonticula alba TaxID=691883 RepID=A0A058YZF2_FONAL|nr:hypothetical protein H696_06211 [Fonticula alba]KCV67359.1 hypothetical protein H696_06211 [Fonticula alba]|eukprot:XP_009498232.1 hypothetical protein H696_06211 [Fonticula alba]
MLRIKAFPPLLAQANSDSVISTMLITTDGAVISYSSVRAKTAGTAAGAGSSVPPGAAPGVTAGDITDAEAAGAMIRAEIAQAPANGPGTVPLDEADSHFDSAGPLSRQSRDIAVAAAAAWAQHTRAAHAAFNITSAPSIPGALVPQHAGAAGEEQLSTLVIMWENAAFAVARAARFLVVLHSQPVSASVALGPLRTKATALGELLSTSLRDIHLPH